MSIQMSVNAATLHDKGQEHQSYIVFARYGTEVGVLGVFTDHAEAEAAAQIARATLSLAKRAGLIDGPE
jgi:hypothetical protein